MIVPFKMQVISLLLTEKGTHGLNFLEEGMTSEEVILGKSLAKIILEMSLLCMIILQHMLYYQVGLRKKPVCWTCKKCGLGMFVTKGA